MADPTGVCPECGGKGGQHKQGCSIAGGVGTEPAMAGGGNKAADRVAQAGKAVKSAGKGVENVGKGVETTGKAVEKGGQAIKGVGKAVEGAGKAAELGGKALKGASEVVDKAGDATMKGGKAIMSAGKALTATKLGAIVGIPLMGIGGATVGAGAGMKGAAAVGKAGGGAAQAAGKGAQQIGKGAQTAGDNMSKAGQNVQKAGKNIGETGKGMQNFGDSLEKSAKHMEKYGGAAGKEMAGLTRELAPPGMESAKMAQDMMKKPSALGSAQKIAAAAQKGDAVDKGARVTTEAAAAALEHGGGIKGKIAAEALRTTTELGLGAKEAMLTGDPKALAQSWKTLVVDRIIWPLCFMMPPGCFPAIMYMDFYWICSLCGVRFTVKMRLAEHIIMMVLALVQIAFLVCVFAFFGIIMCLINFGDCGRHFLADLAGGIFGGIGSLVSGLF